MPGGILNLTQTLFSEHRMPCERVFFNGVLLMPLAEFWDSYRDPPCETWTAARHQVQTDAADQPLRGPRPLRSAHDLLGLVQLTYGELAQVFTENILLLKGVLLACLVTVAGGATILEHPATPYDEDFAGIWRLGLVRMLMKYLTGPFRRISVEQWRYGSSGIKPTTFMFSNTDLPTQHLMGRIKRRAQEAPLKRRRSALCFDGSTDRFHLDVGCTAYRADRKVATAGGCDWGCSACPGNI
eukprot:s753_g20.t1